MSRAIAYVGLGSNLNAPRERILAAFEALGALPETRVVGRSSLYRSAPQGHAQQPDFVNAVAKLETALAPTALLAALHEIEKRHGRDRPYRNAPRTLDLDLLLYGTEPIVSAELTVPHPRMHQRAFVLKPLLELDPQAQIPGRGRAQALLERCADQPAELID